MKYKKLQQQVTSCYDCPFMGYVLGEENQFYCNHIKSPDYLMDFGSLVKYLKNKLTPEECPLKHTSVLVFIKGQYEK